MEWGPEIGVNGVRPDWLRDDETMFAARGWSSKTEYPVGRVTNWHPGRAIRLPADHPYYAATNAGFTYWPGGDRGPDDWDGGPVLNSNRAVAVGFCHDSHGWVRTDADLKGAMLRVIGYRKRVEPDYKALYEQSQADLQQSDEALRALNRRFLRLERAHPHQLEYTFGEWVTPDDDRQPDWPEGAEYQMASTKCEYVNPNIFKMGNFRGHCTSTKYRRVYFNGRLRGNRIRIGQEWLTPEEIEARFETIRSAVAA